MAVERIIVLQGTSCIQTIISVIMNLIHFESVMKTLYTFQNLKREQLAMCSVLMSQHSINHPLSIMHNKIPYTLIGNALFDGISWIWKRMTQRNYRFMTAG